MTAAVFRKIGLSAAFPLLVFAVMLIITRIAGITYYVSGDLWRFVSVDASLTSVIAIAIYMQFKEGRFDFSGGATMILTAIIAGNLAVRSGESPVVFMLLCLIVNMILSLVTAFVYILTRMPIIICTIGITLLYESLTYLVFDAGGLSIMSRPSLAMFGNIPGIYFPFLLAVLAFIFYSYITVAGRRGKLLANNQKAAVNIGIRENRNVIITYIYCGFILGMGALMYGSKNIVNPQANLSTSGILFSYIVPAFIGMFIGLASIDAIGVVIAAIGMSFLNYGLNCMGVGSGGYQQIIFGLFMFAFYAFSARAPILSARRRERKGAEKT
jgi:ribose transport system permease protein